MWAGANSPGTGLYRWDVLLGPERTKANVLSSQHPIFHIWIVVLICGIILSQLSLSSTRVRLQLRRGAMRCDAVRCSAVVPVRWSCGPLGGNKSPTERSGLSWPDTKPHSPDSKLSMHRPASPRVVGRKSRSIVVVKMLRIEVEVLRLPQQPHCLPE
jgi:hypothetical protein